MLPDTASYWGRERTEREVLCFALLCFRTQSWSISHWLARLLSGEGMSGAGWKRKDRELSKLQQLHVSGYVMFSVISVKWSLRPQEVWRKRMFWNLCWVLSRYWKDRHVCSNPSRWDCFWSLGVVLLCCVFISTIGKRTPIGDIIRDNLLLPPPQRGEILTPTRILFSFPF